jgi:hypothetical protein
MIGAVVVQLSFENDQSGGIINLGGNKNVSNFYEAIA